MRRMTSRRFTGAVTALAAMVLTVSCAKKDATPESATVRIIGAGSTFVYPIMSKWAAEYGKLKPNVQINYQSIGSGGGIRQASEGTVDFGATDGPMTDEQLTQAKVGRLLHIPVVMGASVAAYNLPGFTGELRLSSTALANIFLGKITKWSDPAIVKTNPGAKLPDLPIGVVHRSDGSGTTYIWTDYLAKVSPEWKTKVGTNTAVSWPAGIGAKGNEGIAGMVQQAPGSIGYMEMTYAVQNNIPFASIENAAGTFVRPSPDGVTAAAAAAQVPDDFRYSITNAPGADAYPIAGTVWLLIPATPTDKAKGHVVVDFAKWIITAGQEYAPALNYSRLPAPLATRVEQSLSQVQ